MSLRRQTHPVGDSRGDPDHACARVMLLAWPCVGLVGITTTVVATVLRETYCTPVLALAGRPDIRNEVRAGVPLTRIPVADPSLTTSPTGTAPLVLIRRPPAARSTRSTLASQQRLLSSRAGFCHGLGELNRTAGRRLHSKWAERDMYSEMIAAGKKTPR